MLVIPIYVDLVAVVIAALSEKITSIRSKTDPKNKQVQRAFVDLACDVITILIVEHSLALATAKLPG